MYKMDSYNGSIIPVFNIVGRTTTVMMEGTTSGAEQLNIPVEMIMMLWLLGALMSYFLYEN